MPAEIRREGSGSAMSFRFDFDWVDASQSSDTLACHSMAKVTIGAGGEIVTSVVDRWRRTPQDRFVLRDYIVVPMIGVAEWLACNWWHIFHEIGNAAGQPRPDFELRHNLAFVGDGFVLPRLTMIPASGAVDLRWRRYKPEHASIEFVSEGTARVARSALEACFREVIEATIARLRDRGAAPEALCEEWAAVNTHDPEEREFCRAAALLGLDPFDVTDERAAAIAAFWESAEPALRDEALAAADADSLPEVGMWLSRNLQSLADMQSGDWPRVRRDLPPASGERPWERGYDMACSVRCQLGAGQNRYEFAEAGAPLAVHVRREPTLSPRIDGLVAPDAPACVTKPRGAAGARFMAARALGDYLGRSGPGPGLLSTLATDRQAQSRAFAAEFLAPAGALRARIGGAAFVESDDVDEFAREFDVSPVVISRQIENHGLASIVE